MSKRKATPTLKVENVDTLKAENQTILVFKASKPMTKEEFDLFKLITKEQEEESGVTIVAAPYSSEVFIKEGD